MTLYSTFGSIRRMPVPALRVDVCPSTPFSSRMALSSAGSVTSPAVLARFRTNRPHEIFRFRKNEANL